ncbi:glycoside hydrolase family 65 protein [Companilactobacillus sp.]|jgi:maltose phosphorylase|uniref:glycoside hydrolase family 65 protein n=1 Tax=Companilactobacillus sp. TaxID=2767905 RepID=UPI0025BFBA54|nr:glycoside hydrolase family 65 protein [Companilactobacillus sp.]MCH4008173.1 glycoside hydrolase family 65 protein [Companilactobacillus sp.]MCH4051648.1 glycoside hydrolase family 65 protein [Companilactobacillus sp.]MCH4076116.1 glycoside hydrolase family 65 protein [Companilactobacillus sp.]MCH4124691.1 glycoside hydrolase family 65 protein [Companilactobacillus sp.]MCH4131233.1 glycoside hydrolase family 65 protein [Companilactobacillus sp.]
MKRIFEVQPWNVSTHEFKAEDKRLQESMTSLGNGYMGMRGFFDEDYSGDSLPGIYLGGVWYPDKTRVGWWKNGYPKYFGKVINAVNFIKMNFLINGEKLDLAKDEFTDFDLDLHMKNAVLTRSFVVTKGSAKLQFNFERFLSVAQKELSVQKVTVKNLLSEKVDLKIISSIDANVKNEDANYDEHFWEVRDIESGSLVAETKQNDFGTPRFTSGMQANYVTSLEPVGNEITDYETATTFAGELQAGETASFEKRVVVVTSRDYDTQDQLVAAMNDLSVKISKISYDELLTAHENIWAERWQQSDVKIEGDTEAQQGMRFNLFGLFTTYYGDDARLNIGPKGFTGEKYGGATYWDTEAFAVPVYLGITKPEITRNLLMYRYKQLDGAFVNAKEQGLKGALFPMVTFNGIECHNEWEITFEEIHRNGDIAFAIYNYTRYTGDKSYVLNEGSKVLTEISRFWADRVHFSQRNNQYMIHGVTGPDEYENNVDNNWNTNYLARWTLEYTLKVLSEVGPEQAKELNVSDAEKAKWQDIVDRMYLPYDKDLDIFVQHDGFLDKDLQPVSAIPKDQLPINQHWSWDKILRSPYIKQGDVLQVMYDFIDEFTPEQKKHNFDFYEQYTVHESSLSPAIYSVMAADLHYEKKAVELYERTARLDLDNYNNDTVDGLHITSMTGGWIAMVQGFAGMRVHNDTLSYKPFLPQKWNSYSFRQVFRGRVIEVSVDKSGNHFKLISGQPLDIEVDGKPLTLESLQTN